MFQQLLLHVAIGLSTWQIMQHFGDIFQKYYRLWWKCFLYELQGHHKPDQNEQLLKVSNCYVPYEDTLICGLVCITFTYYNFTTSALYSDWCTHVKWNWIIIMSNLVWLITILFQSPNVQSSLPCLPWNNFAMLLSEKMQTVTVGPYLILFRKGEIVKCLHVHLEFSDQQMLWCHLWDSKCIAVPYNQLVGYKVFQCVWAHFILYFILSLNTLG